MWNRFPNFKIIRQKAISFMRTKRNIFNSNKFIFTIYKQALFAIHSV